MESTIKFPVEHLSDVAAEAFVRPLTVADTHNCVTVESAFPEQERCSLEKFRYRLTECSEICLGLFIREHQNQDHTLIGHVIATRTSSSRVTEASMSMPEGWPPTSKTPGQEHEDLAGNDSRGNYVAVHSLAILPAYQKRKLGRALMNVYVEYVKNQVSYATAIIIIAHNHLIPFYKSLGFKDQGPSECTFGGGGWFDMVNKLR